MLGTSTENTHNRHNKPRRDKITFTPPAVKGRSSPPRTRRDAEDSKGGGRLEGDEERTIHPALHQRSIASRPPWTAPRARPLPPSFPPPRQNLRPSAAPHLITHLGRIILNAWHRMMSAFRPRELLLQRRTHTRKAVVDGSI
jgi:hypothetical protein